MDWDLVFLVFLAGRRVLLSVGGMVLLVGNKVVEVLVHYLLRYVDPPLDVSLLENLEVLLLMHIRLTLKKIQI